MVFACPLDSTANPRIFEFLTQPVFCDRFRPISLVLDEAGIADTRETEAYLLTWTALEFQADRVAIRIDGAEAVTVKVREPKKAKGQEEEETKKAVGQEGEEEKEWREELENKLAWFEEQSECDSICSSEDSAADQASVSSEPEEASSEEEAPVSRMASGTHVAYSNGYFTFTDNRNYPDCRAQVLRRWCKPEHMGTASCSKTLPPSSHGEPRESPIRTMLVLRAWMLGRAKVGGFCDARSSRRRLFAGELRSLRADIVAMSSASNPTSGNETADNRIREWVPRVMLPG